MYILGNSTAVSAIQETEPRGIMNIGIKLNMVIHNYVQCKRVVSNCQIVLLLRQQYGYNGFKRRCIERSGTKRSGTNFSLRKINKRSGINSLYSLFTGSPA